jgi:hypothetical protein
MSAEQRGDTTSGGSSTSGQGKGAGPVGHGSYTIRQGECVSSIAKQHGFFWETIWNHPDNAALKAVRQDPNVLLPGDRLAIPALTTKQAGGQTEVRHRFKRKGEPAKLSLRVLDYEGPRANEDFTINVDGMLGSGTTDSDGCLQVSIPGNALRARLTFPSDGTSYDFELGGVDPVSEISGVQRRLNNLGYDCGPVDNEFGSRTCDAIRQFQSASGLSQTGEPDQETRSRLKGEHGS